MPKAPKFNAKKRITVRDNHVNNTFFNHGKDALSISRNIDHNLDPMVLTAESFGSFESNFNTRSHRHASEHLLKKEGLKVEVLKHNKIKVEKPGRREELIKNTAEYAKKYNAAEDKNQFLKDTFDKVNASKK